MPVESLCADRDDLERLLKQTLESIEALERAIREVEEDLRKIYNAQESARSCIRRSA